MTGVFLETLILAVLTGFLLKGRLRNLTETPLHGTPLILAGLVLRNLPAVFRLPVLSASADAAALYAPLLFLASYVFLVIGIGVNFSRWPMIPILAGTLMNFAVVLANGGFMPVSGKSLLHAGYDMSRIPASGALDMNHVLLTAQARLSFLSDIIAIPRPYPFPQVISIGDIVMCLGMFLFIVIGMSPRRTAGVTPGTAQAA